MYNYEHCNEGQQRVLDSTPYFFLSKEEQVNFHYMMHMRNQLRSANFMAFFESELLQEKFKEFSSSCPFFEGIDYRDSFIGMQEYTPESIGPNSFKAMISNKNQPPFVIRGLITETEAVQEWSHEYFLENFKDVELMAFDYSGEQSKTRFILDCQKLGLAEIISSQLNKKNKRNYYINNSAELFSIYPEMINDIGSNTILSLFEGHSMHTFCQLFIGNLKTWGTSWHAGNGTSSALMINGSKRWFFIDPRLSYILKPFFDGSNLLASTDVRQDLSFHRIHNPLYAYAPKLYVDLKPGDVLFFNRYWAHAVINLTPLQMMATMRWTINPNLSQQDKVAVYSTLQPVYDNILNSDPTFLKFQFEVYQSLNQEDKYIGDRVYFSQFNNQKKLLGEAK